MPDYSLDLLGPIIIATRDDVAELKQQVSEIRRELEQHHDEITVLTGMVMRITGEHVAWGAMQIELRKLRDRIRALEQQEQ